MSEEGVFIRDVHSLEELNNIIAFTGESMANIEENVSNYIDGVQEVLEKQLEVIGKKLDEAKEWLSEAEEALSSCEASQEYDEESGELRPSCSWEQHAVDAAQEEVNEWQRKYDEGRRIVGECKGEIDDYNDSGGLITPPGGHYLILNMCERQTPMATEQLQEYIGEVYEYKEQDVGGDPEAVTEMANPAAREEDQPMTEDERFDAFKKNVQGIKDEQESESYSYRIKDANRAMRCPCCGLPIQLCTCRNLHADVNLYQ